MLPGIKLYTNLETADRIRLSDGTEQVSVLNNLPATEGTFVPKLPWRKPDKEEWDMIVGRPEEQPAYQSIGLVKLPDDLRAKWMNTGIHQAHNESDIQRLMQKSSHAVAVEATEEWARQFQRVEEPMTTHRIACIPRNLRTVTFNPRENRYLGLHLDSWEKKSLDELAEVRNRMCINLGLSPRYFLFINLEIKQLQLLLDKPYETRARSLIHEFLTNYADYPVIRIRLDPFEAYIAPTENLIHDGSSEDQKHQDVQITMRSFFNVRPVTSGFFQRIRRLFTAS